MYICDRLPLWANLGYEGWIANRDDLKDYMYFSDYDILSLISDFVKVELSHIEMNIMSDCWLDPSQGFCINGDVVFIGATTETYGYDCCPFDSVFIIGMHIKSQYKSWGYGFLFYGDNTSDFIGSYSKDFKCGYNKRIASILVSMGGLVNFY